MVTRSFLAFELPVDIKNTISQLSQEMKRLPLDVRWVAADRIHLTVVFMGNVPVDQLEGIGAVAERVCQRYGAFNIFLRGVGFFGSRWNPRVLWVGLDGDVERISYFRDALQKHLRPFGIKVEKRQFRPHLTLGRFRRGIRRDVRLDELLSKYQGVTSPKRAFGELVLFKSDLRPDGAVYTRLNSWALVGRY